MSEETTVEEIELSKEAKGVIDSVEKMTVLELSQLVKALEDKFGVVAAAPVAVAGAVAPGAGDEDDAGSDTVDVILKSAATEKVGDGKIFITPVEEAYRIRTGEKGKASLK